MRATTDLHPDDTTARNQLATNLYQLRHRKGLTQPAVNHRLGATGNLTNELERQRNWQIRTVQAWARALHTRLDLRIDGLTIPDDGDTLAAIYAAQQPTTTAAEDRLDLRILINDLRRIRVSLGLSQHDLGVRLGCSGPAVSRRESQPDPLQLRTAQRYCRALGGSLQVSLDHAEQLAVTA